MDHSRLAQQANNSTASSDSSTTPGDARTSNDGVGSVNTNASSGHSDGTGGSSNSNNRVAVDKSTNSLLLDNYVDNTFEKVELDLDRTLTLDSWAGSGLDVGPTQSVSKIGLSSKLGDIGDDFEEPWKKIADSYFKESTTNSFDDQDAQTQTQTQSALHNQQAPELMEGTGDSNSSMSVLLGLRPSGKSGSSKGSSNISDNSIERLLRGADAPFDKSNYSFEKVLGGSDNSLNSLDKIISMDFDTTDTDRSNTHLSDYNDHASNMDSEMLTLLPTDVDQVVSANDFKINNGRNFSATTNNKSASVDPSLTLNQQQNVDNAGDSGKSYNDDELLASLRNAVSDSDHTTSVDGAAAKENEDGNHSSTVTSNSASSSTHPSLKNNDRQHKFDGAFDSESSLPSIEVGNIPSSNSEQQTGPRSNSPSVHPFLPSNLSLSDHASRDSQRRRQQQQREPYLKDQQQQQQGKRNNSNAHSSIVNIVNNQLPQLSPQTANNSTSNQRAQMDYAGLQQEKMKLIRRLQEIERAGMGKNHNRGQQFFAQQQQMILQQQQQQEIQRQFGMGNSLKQQPQNGLNSLQVKAGQQQQQRQLPLSNQFQQRLQQQQMGLSQMAQMPIGFAPTPIAIDPTPSPFSTSITNDNSSNTNNALRKQQQQQPSSIFAETAANSNSNISSVIGSGRKETPLQSFLRNKRSSIGSVSGNITAPQLQPQSKFSAGSTPFGGNNNMVTTASILDATPMDFGAQSNNPFLRKQMMASMDRSVSGCNTSARGRRSSAGRNSSSSLSSSIRQSMMLQMAPGGSRHQRSNKANNLMNSRSEHGTTSTSSSASNLSSGGADIYQSTGITQRHASADHLMLGSSRHSMSVGTAKAQNRRLNAVSRSSSSSFGTLTKSKSNGGLKKDFSAGSLIPVKRGNGVGGRGGFGAKHKLSQNSTISLRSQSVPFMIQRGGGSASERQQQRMDEGNNHNDGWV